MTPQPISVPPPQTDTGYPIDRLGALLNGLPHLDVADADSFAADLAALRTQLGDPLPKTLGWGDDGEHSLPASR